jgi:hypothetical protein
MAILDAAKLRAYNIALTRHLGSRKLASLTENREPRRVLDDIWGDSNEAVEFCLGKADWNFGTRSTKQEYDPALEPSFGMKRVYVKPDDFVRLTTISANEYFSRPLVEREYTDEGPYWITDHEELFVRYVSSHENFGFDSSLWPESFVQYLGAYLAHESCERITNSNSKMSVIYQKMNDCLKHARSRDAMDEGTKFPPAGSWVRARGGDSHHGERRR